MNGNIINDGLEVKSDKIYSFLMIGQSNMSGRGNFIDAINVDNDNCVMFRMGRWQKLRDPVNSDRPLKDINFPSGVSMAPSFANAVSNHYNIKVGMIPSADGGTCMDQWEKGSPLYDHAVMLTKIAMRTSTLVGIIWHQGESDCGTEEMAIAHEQKFLTMIKSLKEDIGAPNVPVIIGELAHDYSPVRPTLAGNRPEIINQGYHHIASENKDFAVVSSSGLQLKEDGLHFSSPSLHEFGIRYFEKYKSLSYLENNL